MLLGIVAALVANAATVLAAGGLVRRWGTGKEHLDLPLFLAARLSLITCAILLAGSTGTLSPVWLGALGAAALVVLLVKKVRPPAFPSPLPGTLAQATAAILLVRALLQVWFIAPNNFDAVSYHLTKIPEWIRAGGFTRELGVDTHAPFPAGFELVEAWWVVFLRHDVLIEAAGLEFLILGFAACRGLARELGLNEATSAWAGIVYVLTPGPAVSSMTCLNDVPVAALVILAMSLCLARAPWPWIAMVGGLGIGIKPTFAYAAPGFLLLEYLGRREPRSASPAGARVALCALGLFAGLYWYARNLAWYGNPIHPVGSAGLLASTGELKIQMGPSLVKGLKNLLVLANDRVYDSHVAYGGLLVKLSGWGVVAFSIGAPALWFFVREIPRAGRVLMSFLVSLVSVLFLVNHDHWFMRFVLFFPAILALSAAWLAFRHRAVAGVLAAGLCFQFVATCFSVELSRRGVKDLAAQGWRARSFAPMIGFRPPDDGAVLYRIVEPVHLRGESYLLYGPDYSRRVVYFRGSTREDLERQLRESGARYLYCARIGPVPDPLVESLVQLGALRRIDGRLYEFAGGP